MQTTIQQFTPANNRHYIPWLDYAKVLGIFLVIWGHAAGSADVRMYIWSFHMPMFFVISGLLYRPMTLKESLKKDWRSLVIPYLLLNLFCWMYYIAIHAIKGTLTLTMLCRNAGAILLGLGYNTDLFTPVSTPCWFIYSLILVRIMLAIAYRGKQTLLFCLVVFSLAMTAFLQYKHIDLWIPFDSAFLVMPFVGVGIVFCNAVMRFTQIRKYWSLAALLIIMALWCLLAAYNGRVDANSCRMGNSFALYYIVAILGTLSFFKCSSLVCNMIGSDTLTGGGKLSI